MSKVSSAIRGSPSCTRSSGSSTAEITLRQPEGAVTRAATWTWTSRRLTSRSRGSRGLAGSTPPGSMGSPAGTGPSPRGGPTTSAGVGSLPGGTNWSKT